MKKETKLFRSGMRDGFPIGMGYFAVSFSLGIAAERVGVTALQGFFLSLLNNASAGEYAGITAIGSDASYWAVALLILIANARYLLMSCALSQRVSPELPLRHRLLLGFDITDEIFGLAVASPAPVPPIYMYGAFSTTIPFWAIGTVLGIVAGELLPPSVVGALSAAIYGMFIAIIVPPCKTNKVIFGLVLVSFAASVFFSVLPGVSALSESLRVIILTVVISAAAAVLFPVKDTEESEAAAK